MTKKSVKANVVTEEVVLSSGITLRLISWGKEVYSSNRPGASVIDVLPEWITTRVELVHHGKVRGWNKVDSITLMHLESEDVGNGGSGSRLDIDWDMDAVEALRVAFAMTEEDYERFFSTLMWTRVEVAACPIK